MKRLIIQQTVSMLAVSSWINPQAAVRSIIVGMRQKLVVAVFEETGDAKADWGKFNTSISRVEMKSVGVMLIFRMWTGSDVRVCNA